MHCLYGCDRNKLAIELAKLSLWLESYAEGLPLTFLDHRLVHGDALTGPFFASLSTLPVTGGVLDPLLAGSVADRLDTCLQQARRLVATLNASIGRDVTDLMTKQAAKDRLDRVLHPLRQLARAWAGAAMLRERDGDDVWLALARGVAETGAWPDTLTDRQAKLLSAGVEAVAWDLVFPEVFPGGFSGRSRQSALGRGSAEYQRFRRGLRSRHFGRPNTAAAGSDRTGGARASRRCGGV